MTTPPLTPDVPGVPPTHHDPSGATPRRSGRPRLQLARFRRYCFFSIVLSLGGLMWVTAAPGLADVDGAPGTFAAMLLGLLGSSGALWYLTDHHIPLYDVDAGPRRWSWSRSTWLAIGWSSAVLAGVGWMPRTDLAFWAVPVVIVLSFTLVPLPRPRQIAISVAATVGLAVVGLASVGGLQDRTADAAGAQVTGVVVLVAVVMPIVVASVWTWDVAAELDAARGAAAALAVADERLRFAAELHDIQGHHLQVIALKSELAARLVEQDASRARTEMEAVRTLAATALTETRDLVQGYRRTTLAAELTNASNVLTSAAIDAQVTTAADDVGADLDPERRHLLGLVVREATTNVLRHSAATWARFELHDDRGTTTLRVTNDQATGPEGEGSGLVSLHDRLTAVGGELATGRHDDVFELTVSLPAGPLGDAATSGIGTTPGAGAGATSRTSAATGTRAPTGDGASS